VYLFDEESVRWGLNTIQTNDKKFQFKNNSWDIVT
jgi:hypothetical protein